MTLDELKTYMAAKLDEHNRIQEAEGRRRQDFIIRTLAELGFTTTDGWLITRHPDCFAVSLSHPPEWPNALDLLVAGDGSTDIYPRHGRNAIDVTPDSIYYRIRELNER